MPAGSDKLMAFNHSDDTAAASNSDQTYQAGDDNSFAGFNFDAFIPKISSDDATAASNSDQPYQPPDDSLIYPRFLQNDDLATLQEGNDTQAVFGGNQRYQDGGD